MQFSETSQVEDGIVYFYQVWRCCDNTWEKKVRWDDLDTLSDVPFCSRCYSNGALFFS